MWDANEAKIKEEPLDIKDNQLYIKTENFPILSSFDHLYVKTENGSTHNSFDHLYVKTRDCSYLNSLEHDHCYCRGVTKVKRVQKIHYPFMAKDIFRSPVESFNGMMTRLESNERDEILARKTRIPLIVVDIINSPWSSFHELMDQPELSPGQIKVCHDIRRRGKNKAAARNCRKRKMDTIDELQSQVDQVC